MDSVALATPPSESDTSTKPDISGKLELTRGHITGDGTTDFDLHDTESVKDIVCTGVLEFVPGRDRGAFMDQCYRILVPGGKMTITVPYWTSWRAYYDSRIEWPPFCEQSFLYYNKTWRETNMKELKLECDFDFTYGYVWSADTQSRSDESRSFWTAHYANAVDALQLMLTKK